MLKECFRLSHISLHNNPITLEIFRETDGFEDYDKRRSARSNKQVRQYRLMAWTELHIRTE